MIDLQVYSVIAESLCCSQDMKPTMDLRKDLFMNEEGLNSLVAFLNDDFAMPFIPMYEARAWHTVNDVVQSVKRRMEC